MTAMAGFLSVSKVTAMLEISQTPKNRTAAASAATKRRIITSGLAANSNNGANHLNIGAPIRVFLHKYERFVPGAIYSDRLQNIAVYFFWASRISGITLPGQGAQRGQNLGLPPQLVA